MGDSGFMKNESGWGNNTMKYALPTEPDPPDSVCFIVRVPNSYYHITAFKGAIYDLSLWWNWEPDDAHTARVAAYAWRRVWLNLKQTTCDLVPVGSIGETFEEQDTMNFRTITDNGECLLQWKQCECPETWITLANLKDVPNKGQSGDGNSPPPPAPGGGTTQYCYQLNANQTLLIPAGVSTGDIITLQSADGAGWDGVSTSFGGPYYFCPDGRQFFLGACVGARVLVGTDPLSAISHMTIIAQINGSFYPFLGGAITVPSGVSNAQLLLQVNDQTLSDNAGSYNVCVQVQNNQATAWRHKLDMRVSNWGFVGDNRNGVAGVWTAGVGFVPGVNPLSFDVKRSNTSAISLTQVGADYIDTVGSPSVSSGIAFEMASTPIFSQVPLLAGSQHVQSGVISSTGTDFWIEIEDGNTTGLVLETIYVAGTGTDDWPTAPTW
jgi:hypothetical protein